jgi:hypothetical protein
LAFDFGFGFGFDLSAEREGFLPLRRAAASAAHAFLPSGANDAEPECAAEAARLWRRS